MAVLLTPLLLLPLAACGSGGDGGSTGGSGSSGAGSSSAAQTAKRGGSLTVLANSGWPAGLDPGTSPTGGANLSQWRAIYGGLFQLRADDDGTNAHIIPFQAESGTFSKDLLTLTIKLRPGITFSDGTPLDAKAVIWNFERDANSKLRDVPNWQLRKTDPFTSPDPLTVVVHMSAPNAALLDGFPDTNANWMISPTAFKKMGAKKFRVTPVGAGPFTVVSDVLDSKLVLKRNPTFFKKGLPYLDKLTFTVIGGDQAAYQALLAGSADAYESMSQPALIEQASANPKVQVTLEPGVSPYMIEFNTRYPPFNNKTAREAIYYATDWATINEGLFDGKRTLVQSFTTPFDLFYHQKTPGYRTFDLAKAKALVKQLGGLKFTLIARRSDADEQLMKALQTQWQKAGMHVTFKDFEVSGLINEINSGKWQGYLTESGAWDPATGNGLGFHFDSTSPYSGVKDPHLDALIREGVSTGDPAKRDRIYQQVAKYISDQALGAFGFAQQFANVAVAGVHGPGLITKVPPYQQSPVIWSEVWRSK